VNLQPERACRRLQVFRDSLGIRIAWVHKYADRSSGALLHLEFYAAETFHQIEELAVDLDRINRRPAMEPLARTRAISGAPLLKGGSFLNYSPSRSVLVS